MSMPEVAKPNDVRSPAVKKKTVWRSLAFQRDFQWSNIWIAVISPEIYYPRAQVSNHTQIDRWKLPENFIIFLAIRALKRDFGQSVVSLKVTVSDYWSWWKTLRNDIYCICSVTLWKSHFLRRNCQVKLSCFSCRANRESKSKSETTPRLVSTPRIHWWSQICQTSDGWKAHFSR